MPTRKNESPDQDIEDALSGMFPDEPQNADPPSRDNALEEKRQNANTEPEPTSDSNSDGSAARPAELLSPSGGEKKRIHGPYVAKPVVFRLQEAQTSLRRITDESVTQSEIVEAALRMALQEFEENGRESGLLRLVRRIRST